MLIVISVIPAGTCGRFASAGTKMALAAVCIQIMAGRTG